MMTYLPKDELKPDDDGGKKGPSTNRIIIWVVVGAVGLYLLGSGLIGILTK
ncbi:hypothetical protein [Cryobacterium sp. AP23]|jgi:hypothetical protein